jgi:hypothetical protein
MAGAGIRHLELHLIEEALSETRSGAEAIHEPGLVKCIDSAIAEVRRITATLQEPTRPSYGSKSSNVVDFVGYSAKLRH